MSDEQIKLIKEWNKWEYEINSNQISMNEKYYYKKLNQLNMKYIYPDRNVFIYYSSNRLHANSLVL